MPSHSTAQERSDSLTVAGRTVAQTPSPRDVRASLRECPLGRDGDGHAPGHSPALCHGGGLSERRGPPHRQLLLSVLSLAHIVDGKVQQEHASSFFSSGSVCQRSSTELVLRLFALRRVTVEGFRMTDLASVILSGAKNLNSCRAMARKSQTDPLPFLQ